MPRILPVIAAALLSIGITPCALSAQEAASPRIDLEQRMLLRCSATFALVADRQQRGEEWALEYPPMAEAGREFFVRASALVMDQAGLDTEQVAAILETEARDIWDADTIDDLMPICLPMIVTSGESGSG